MGEGTEFFRNVRTPNVGEEMVLQNNVFVEVVLPEMGTIRKLTEAERQAYRAPYPTPESRKPMLVWPREVPVAGEPQVAAYFAENLKNIETNYVGPGYHYIQEDHPHLIGRELADWLRRQK